MPALEDAIAFWEKALRTSWGDEYRENTGVLLAAARAHLTDSLDARRYRVWRRHGAIDYANQFLPCSREEWHAAFEKSKADLDERWRALALAEPQEAKTCKS